MIIRAAVFALLVGLAATACNAPWEGPKSPTGSQTISATMDGYGPFKNGQEIQAATTLSALRALIPACQAQAPNPQPDRCWTSVADQPGRLYLAVLIEPSCTQPTKDSIVLTGQDLYFIHWIGHPNGVCNIAMMMPSYRLYEIRLSDLPHSGTLVAHLQIQNATDGTKTDVSTAHVQLGA